MDKDTQQDRIDAHLLGRNSREERLEFEEELTRNADLSKQTAETEEALAALELATDAALKERLRALESKLSGKATVVAESPQEVRREKTAARVVQMKQNRKGTLNLIGYAAALLLALAAGWWAFSTSAELDPGQLAMESFEPFPNLTQGTVRGEEDVNPAAAAFLAYDNGAFAAAEAEFRRLEPTEVHRFYLGQSLLGQQKFAAAAEVFTPLAQRPAAEFSLAPESNYFLALSQLGSGNAAAAKQRLQQITADPTHPNAGQAQQLLADL